MVPSMMVDSTISDGYRVLVQKENSFELTRTEFSNHHFCVCKSKDSSELKFRKIFNSNEFSPMRGDGNTRKIFQNFNSEDSKSSLTISDGNKRNYKIFQNFNSEEL
jgi:5-deoxy-D-glucuronate isomerase